MVVIFGGFFPPGLSVFRSFGLFGLWDFEDAGVFFGGVVLRDTGYRFYMSCRIARG